MVSLDVIRDAIPSTMSILNGHYVRPHRLEELQLIVCSLQSSVVLPLVVVDGLNVHGPSQWTLPRKVGVNERARIFVVDESSDIQVVAQWEGSSWCLMVVVVVRNVHRQWIQTVNPLVIPLRSHWTAATLIVRQCALSTSSWSRRATPHRIHSETRSLPIICCIGSTSRCSLCSSHSATTEHDATASR